MAKDDTPLTPVFKSVEKIKAFLANLAKKIIKGLDAILRPIFNLLKHLKKALKQIGSIIGKAVVDEIRVAGAFIESVFNLLKAEVKASLRLAQRILDMIRKAVDPKKIVRALKTLVVKLVGYFNRIADKVNEFYDNLNILERALKIMETFKSLLVRLFNWIGEVTGALAAIRKVKKILKAFLKALKPERKNAKLLLKETKQLKAA